jgi:hypothetical protein
VTDLPRFFEGEFGKLDFTTMNEIMKRLDLLLPLVQNAAGGGGFAASERTMVFPVYAVRTAYQTPEEFYKYDWWEITVVEDVVRWHDDDQDGEIQTNLRKGVSTEAGGNQYGLIPFSPNDESPNTAAFTEGFAIAIVVRSANTDAETTSPSGGVRCLLFPLNGGQVSGFVRIDGDPTTSTISMGEGLTRDVKEYPATFFQPKPGPEGEAGLEVADDEAIAVDLNDPTSFNKPTLEGSEATLTERAFDVGTMFQATKVGEHRYAFAHLIRFDVTCQ